MVHEALLEASAGLGRIERRGFDFVTPEAFDEGLRADQQFLDRFPAA
jgi:hypothetical protein